MVAPTITTADMAANTQGQINTANTVSSSYSSGVDSAVNFANYLTANMGAAAVETAYVVGGENPANIVAAAVNGSYAASGSYSSSSAGSTSQYLTGGTTSYVTDADSSYYDSSSSTDYETQLATMQQNQAELMMVQFQVGDMQTTTQMTSNIENIRQSTLTKVIQNMKV
jgi:hypothetical protein